MGRLPVAVVGATGYTGAELCRLLLDHPDVDLVALAGRGRAGERIDAVFPHLSGRLSTPVEPFDADALAERARLAFCALPHGEGVPIVGALRARGLVVIDLSADFRLRDPAAYRAWYGAEHGRPDLLAGAVYGLPERRRAELAGATLVAAPGCYPTAAALALGPLVDAGLVERTGLVVDAKSGVSGAGRAATLGSLFCEAGEGVRAYKIAGAHRHTPEMEQELSGRAGPPVRLLFTPHLVPMSRGILAACYGRPTDAARPATAYLDALRAAYAGEPFVQVVAPSSPPDTSHVRGSNHAHVTAALDARTGLVVALAAIDNLVKGASGQAVQCMNLALGLDETAGLRGVALFP